MAGIQIRRLYFSTAEACRMAQVTPYVLMKWIKKYPQLKPSLHKSGKRLFRQEDIDLILKIRDLASEGKSDAEIRNILEGADPYDILESVALVSDSRRDIQVEWIGHVKQGLQEILEMLK